MAEDVRPLTDEERAELEALRAEKAARLERERAERERAELEQLRSDRAQVARAPKPTAEDQRIRDARARGEKLMVPDDDLRMPTGQKIVLAAIGLLAVLAALMHLFVR